MWDKFKSIVGYIWSFPVTFFGLAYALAFHAMGWYLWFGVRGDALVWLVEPTRAPRWLMSLWKGWGGHTIGNVVVLSQDPSRNNSIILTHEQKHVNQCMRLGIFQPIMYGLNMLAIKWGCPGSDSYYDNPFEIDARRHAGQKIDIVGLANKFANRVTQLSNKENQ